MNKKVNRIRWDKLKLEWDGRLGAAYAFKGIKDYEEWAMSMSPPIDPRTGDILPLEEGWMGPEDFGQMDGFGNIGAPQTDKERLFAQAMAIREQLEEAIAVEDYEKAEILQKTLNVLEIKYNKL